MGEDGKPRLSTIDPVAFFSNGQLFECIDWETQGDTVPVRTLLLLRKAYAPGQSYQLWRRGVPLGTVQTISSCIGEEDISQGGAVDLQGCVRYTSAQGSSPISADSLGIAFTGRWPTAKHPAINGKVNPSERREFLRLAASAFGQHGAVATPAQIHSGVILKTQLRAGHSALAGSALVQLPADKQRSYHSYRIFLVAEESGGHYSLVLSHFHQANIELEDGTDLPKPDEELGEENSTDKEVFMDNFPLFPGEPDAIITLHTYYESASYSVYRRNGAGYKLVYTGCGGGD